MLDWMKDKMGRKGPLQALAAGGFKDDAEKLELLEAVATTVGLKGEELIPLLGHADAAIQQRLSTLFLSRVTPTSGSALIEAFLGAEAAARPVLIKTLSRVKGEILSPLLDLVLKEAKQERLRAAWDLALELPPDISTAYVDRAFKEGPTKARFDALRLMLARKPAPELRATLKTALDDGEMRVRRMALDAMVKLEGNDVFEAMLDRVSGDSDPEIRQIAGGYLQKFIATAPAELRPAIIGRLLLAGDAALQAQLINALFGTGDQAQLLLEILTFAKTVLGARHTAILDSMKSLGDGLLDHAIRLLDHSDPDLRIQAVLLLERFASPKTASAVVKLLGDTDWWVRIMACDTLGRLKDPRTLPYLDKLLVDPDCKWAAIDAIGLIGGDVGLTLLVKLLSDAQVEVRLAAMSSLGKVEDKRVDPYIEQLSKADPSVDLRVRAVELLRMRRGTVGAGKTAVTSAELTHPMERLFAFARESGASDLHVTPDEPPFLRINGIIQRVDMKALSAGQVDALVDEILDPVRRPLLDKHGAVDFCYTIPGAGRYRVNVFRQIRGTGVVVRIIPGVTPTLASLGLPKHLDEIGTYHQGIILLTGPAGAGKSTTLTALVNVLNESRSTHVLSLEDPIEFLHSPKKALINQREIGRDSRSFAAAMRGALREDPDIIIVGELRDKETMRLAMVAAETGHLVIATMQTTSATATIDKLVESFPTDEQQQVRVQLAGSLKLIVSQILVPSADGKSRVATFEILKSTSPVRAIIRDGKTYQLGSAMQIGRSQGMLTIDASLELLLADGKITQETAYNFAQKKELFTKARTATASRQAVSIEEAEIPAIPTDVAAILSARHPPVAPMGPGAPPHFEAPREPAPLARPATPLQVQPIARPPIGQPAQAQPLPRPPTAEPIAAQEMPEHPKARPSVKIKKQTVDRENPTLPAQQAVKPPPPVPPPAPAPAPPVIPPVRKRISIPRDE
jgi:twitching motility protein PilT